MCLILWSWQQHPECPLVLAANRDEFYDRPTAPADFWPEAPQVLAGRDLVGGGSWLGVTGTGRWAAITNFRDPSEPPHGGPSRGWLVRDYLLGATEPEPYLREVESRAAAYAGFNLLVGNRRELWYFGNRQGVIRSLSPGLYGLSNGLLDTPWPKVTLGKRALAEALAAPAGPDPEGLFSLLADRSRPPDHHLPATGVSREWERILSSRFIVSPSYGTRSSTVLFLGPRETTVRERTFFAETRGCREVRRSFSESGPTFIST